MHDLLVTALVPDAPKLRRQRRRPARQLIAAAVSIEPALYDQALMRALSHYDGNFSLYVRTLIARDLAA